MKNLASILVATDLGEGSDEVVRAAAALAALLGAKLHLLHAFDLDASAYAAPPGRPGTFPERLRAAGRALEEQLRRTTPADVVIGSREIVIYAAHRAIVDRAEAVAADLIVLGPHRGRATADRFLGSTTDRVIRSAPVPCLVVHGPLRLPLRRVLVPLDLSEPGRGALDAALAWSDALRPHPDDAPGGPRVTALHVIPRDFEGGPLASDVVGPALHEEVEAARRRTGGAGPLELREAVRWGDTPAGEILRAAEEEDADLLVVATHGRGAVKRALVGSVASAVARGAGRPVLLVPPALWAAGPEDAGPGETDTARFRELDRGEIDAILARNHVGRIGYARGVRMGIRPVHYVYSDGWVYGRTAPGAKWETLGETAYGWWPVVFEVDEVEDLFRWRSVLVQGGFYVVSPGETESEREEWARAVELLRTLVPETFRGGDPVPGRTLLFRIAVQEVSGREALPPGEES